jgi:hypothetical protein
LILLLYSLGKNPFVHCFCLCFPSRFKMSFKNSQKRLECPEKEKKKHLGEHNLLVYSIFYRSRDDRKFWIFLMFCSESSRLFLGKIYFDSCPWIQQLPYLQKLFNFLRKCSLAQEKNANFTVPTVFFSSQNKRNFFRFFCFVFLFLKMFCM